MEESPGSTESHEIPMQMDYKFKNYAGPKYKFSRVVPLSGSQIVNVPLNSTAEVLMEIPTNVFNFAESYMYANIAIPLQAAHTWFYLDGMPLISEVDLYTRSGIYLCQLPNFQNYMKIVRKLFTPYEEFASNDISSFLFPSQALESNVPAVTPNNGNSSNGYVESAYVGSDAWQGLAIGSQINLTLNMKLGAIKKTIFALNKNIVFPDIIVLRILFGPASKFAYVGTSGDDPTAGPGPLINTNAFVAPAPITIGPYLQIYNLTLFLATEKNEDLAQTTRALVNSPSGLNLLIDYPFSYRQALNGQNQNLSYRFNRGHGKNLCCVVSSPFNTNESLNTAYDCFNVTNAGTYSIVNPTDTGPNIGAKVLNYYSQLDNIRLQDITPVCGQFQADDYRENRKFMKDTAYLNSQVYNNNWFHMDKFYEVEHWQECESNLDKGLSLIVERKYDMINNVIPAGTQYNWYTHAIVQKDLHIGRDMIQFQ
jgi:hypothetical protein